MIFDHFFSKEVSSPIAFKKVIVNRKVEYFSIFIIIPILASVCGKNRMLNRENKISVRYKAARNLPYNLFKGL